MKKDKWLLGKDVNGMSVYIEDFSWDCCWYWGGGYIEVYENGRHIEHSHFEQFNQTIDGKDSNLFDGFKSRIVESKLTDTQIWKLCDIMYQFYAFRKSAECFHRGASTYGIESNKKIKSLPMEKKLNSTIEKKLIPMFWQLMNEVERNEKMLAVGEII
jgi:hypothetical protein